MDRPDRRIHSASDGRMAKSRNSTNRKQNDEFAIDLVSEFLAMDSTLCRPSKEKQMNSIVTKNTMNIRKSQGSGKQKYKYLHLQLAQIVVRARAVQKNLGAVQRLLNVRRIGREELLARLGRHARVVELEQRVADRRGRLRIDVGARVRACERER